MKFSIILVLCGPLAAQGVSLRFNPEPMEVLEALRVKHFGLWSVSLCSELPYQRNVKPEEIRARAGQLKLIGPNRARLLLAQRQAASWPSIVVRVVEYLSIGAVVVTASELVKVQPNVIAGLGLGVGTAHVVADRLREEVPDTGPLLAELLEGEVPLKPGDCATRSVFAGLTKGAGPFEARIEK